MKLKVVVIDLELSTRQKRVAAAVLATAVALSAGVASAELPKTFVKGGTLKAADLNASFSDIDQRLTALEHRPRSRVGVMGLMPFSVPPHTIARMSFATEHYDDLDEFDAASSTFTASAGGDYELCLSTSWQLEDVRPFIEGVQHGWLFGYHGDTNGCVTLRLEAGDVLDLRIDNSEFEYENTGGDNDAWLTLTQLE